MAVMNFPSCKDCNDCDDLLKEIKRRMRSTESGGNKGLLTRWADQVYGCQTPQNTVHSHAMCRNHKMTGTWKGHNRAIKTQKGRVKKSIKDYYDNDCGDKVGNPDAARAFMRDTQKSLDRIGAVPPSGYKGPPRPASLPGGPAKSERTLGEWAKGKAQDVCVGGFKAGGAVVGGAGGFVVSAPEGILVGGAAGAASGALYGGSGGTLVAPGVGTVTGAAGGAVIGGAGGAVIGGVYTGSQGAAEWGASGARVGNDLGEWICR